MLDEKTFDYDNYIQERIKKIEDLDERRFAKEVLLDGLANILPSLKNVISNWKDVFVEKQEQDLGKFLKEILKITVRQVTLQ